MEPIKTKTRWGLFRPTTHIEADSTKITLTRRTSWLFGDTETITIPYDKMIFFGNAEDLNAADALYVAEDGKYDVLPQHGGGYAGLETSAFAGEGLGTGRDDFDALWDSEYDMDNFDEDHDADLYLHAVTRKLHLEKEDVLKLAALFEAGSAVKATVRQASGLLCKKQIAYTDKWLFYANGNKVDYVPVTEMAFFVTGMRSLYCGYHRQIQAKINSSAVIKEIKDHCYANAKRLKEEGETHTIGWLFPDKITLTDNAVIHHRKGLFKSSMAYVPYKRVYMVISNTSWLFWKRMTIMGEQNIVPKHMMSRSCAKTIEAVLTKYGVDPTKGDTYNSAKLFPKNWFGRAPKLVCLDDRIIYTPNRLKGKEDLQPSTLRYTDVVSVKYFKRWFGLFGTVVIRGLSWNIRKDQDDSYVEMIIPGLFAFKYKWTFFGGKLRKTLKEKAPKAEFSRIRSKYPI